MKKQMHMITIIVVCLTIVFIGMTAAFGKGIFYSLAITFGTFSYHLVMRLVVGGVINGVKKNRFDYSKPWFQKKGFEDALYKKLKIKSWKIGVPTYAPDTFDVKKHTIEEIVMATCQAEIVHEVIVLLSFVPILFSIIFGDLWVFVLTSIMAACFDMVFVLLQRFNRPRLVKMIRKKE